MEFNYFDIMTQAQKGYARYLEPVCREWGLTRNELDVILFLANNPALDRAVDIVTRRGLSRGEDAGDVGADIFRRGLCLPSDIKMTAKEQDAVIGAVWDCFG